VVLMPECGAPMGGLAAPIPPTHMRLIKSRERTDGFVVTNSIPTTYYSLSSLSSAFSIFCAQLHATCLSVYCVVETCDEFSDIAPLVVPHREPRRRRSAQL
jgi:hypothetical protein